MLTLIVQALEHTIQHSETRKLLLLTAKALLKEAKTSNLSIFQRHVLIIPTQLSLRKLQPSGASVVNRELTHHSKTGKAFLQDLGTTN